MRLRSCEVQPKAEEAPGQEDSSRLASVLTLCSVCWLPGRACWPSSLGLAFFCPSPRCWIGTAREQNLVTAFGFNLPGSAVGWVWCFRGVAGPWLWISSGFWWALCITQMASCTCQPTSQDECLCVCECVCACARTHEEHPPDECLASEVTLGHLRHRLHAWNTQCVHSTSSMLPGWRWDSDPPLATQVCQVQQTNIP